MIRSHTLTWDEIRTLHKQLTTVIEDKIGDLYPVIVRLNDRRLTIRSPNLPALQITLTLEPSTDDS